MTLGLILGSQPDAMVLCHELGRPHIGNFPDYPIPAYRDCLDTYLAAARLTNPRTRFVGVALNTFGSDEPTARRAIEDAEQATGLPATDPLRFGCESIVDVLVRI